MWSQGDDKMKCKNLMRRSCKRKGYKNTPVCKITKVWDPKCSEKCKDYVKKEVTYLKAKSELKKVSKKHAKSERERYSIITDDLEHCIENKYHTGHIDKHEAFRGARRGLSKKWGIIIPLCEKCHASHEIELKWQIKGQLAFMKYYNKTEEEFTEIFKINFLKKSRNLQ
jgi:hypothetical protein